MLNSILSDFLFAASITCCAGLLASCTTPSQHPLTPGSPALVSVQPPADRIPQYGLLEIEAFIHSATKNPFDPDDIAVHATFISPSGKTYSCPGFVLALANEERAADTFRVRFSPNETGAWRWRIVVESRGHRVESAEFKTVCIAGKSRGGIRVSTSNPRCFEFEDGNFYYPIGHNVCWNSLEQYEDQFAKMGRHGESWSRIWLAGWNCEIEWTPRDGMYEGGLGRYELRQAEKLDAIVRAAEANGLYLQLVLHEHCRLSARTNPEWHNNPYNKARGGMCEEPKDFFTDPEARRLARNRLRYIIARWGYSSHVMAWELFNEVDLTDDFRLDRDFSWHEEMVGFIRATDPHNRMVTTSYISTPNANVYRLPGIDYVMSHVYIADVISHFTYLNPVYAVFGKPHFIAEFGRHTDDGVDAQDKTGRVLHSGIWAQFMQPAGGNTMSWWWYDLIDPSDLYYHYAALAKFAEGIDRRTRDWTLETGVLESGRERVLALASPDFVLAWLYNSELLPWSENPPATPPALKGTMRFEDVADGSWNVELWDTYKGEIRSAFSVDASGGQLEFPFEAPGPDVALKLRFAGTAKPETSPRPILSYWDPRRPAQRERTRLSIPRAPKSMPVDADLNKWDGIPMHEALPNDGRAPADHSFRFAVAHDEANLYVIVRVTDREVIRRHGPGGSLWKDDCVEIWIDSRFDADVFNNMPHNPGCWQCVIAPSLEPGGKPDHMVYRHPEWNDRQFPHLEAASRITEDGYIIEARFPLKELRGAAPVEKPDMIGFNVSTCDASPTGDQKDWKHLLWQGEHEWDAREWGVGVME
jgi:hypothetical protein